MLQKTVLYLKLTGNVNIQAKVKHMLCFREKSFSLAILVYNCKKNYWPAPLSVEAKC